MLEKRSWLWAAVLAGAVVLTAGCGEDAGDNGEDAQQQSLSDAQIARVLQVANEGEVALGQLGQSRATETAVRDFSARMVAEHTAARQRLDSVLQAQGLQPADSAIAQQLQQEVQRMVHTLEPLQGAAFDLALMDAQLATHARTAMVGDALLTPQVQNDALDQELRLQRLDVQEHLQDALPIQAGLISAP